jgi:glutamate dehydrogenase/leucine dehydrogenase
MNTKDFLPPAIELENDSDAQLEAVSEIEEVARRLDLEDWITNRLRHTEREISVNLPIIRDDGRAASFTGFRIQHLSSKRPTVGPLTLSPASHISTLRAAAMQASWQAELLNLPFGGAAGAIVCNPDDLSERELRQLSKDYVHALRGILGRYTDVLTPGAGCNEQTMAWMLDSHAHTQGHMELGVITGKPALMWGLPETTELAARGSIVILQQFCARKNRTLAGQRVSIQGFGPLGTAIARSLFDSGAQVVAVADKSGGLFRNRGGIDIPALQRHAAEKRVIFGFPHADAARNADIIEADCDILITAATERQITMANAERVKAGVVLEATRRAITLPAESVLTAMGVVVVPEMLTLAGAAIAAFLEWNQSIRFSTASTAEVGHEVERRISAACDSVLSVAARENVSIRRAAHLVAIDRIARELRLRN